MTAAVVTDVRLAHSIPGRIRFQLPGWSGRGAREIEARLRALPGVLSVQANPLTQTVLARFDPEITDGPALLEAARSLEVDVAAPPADEPALRPLSVQRDRDGDILRARVAVPGLDRDPRLGARLEQYLQRRWGVRARANPLSGRLLIESTLDQADLDEIIADLAATELSALPPEAPPTYPLDPAPLAQSATRGVGASIGLGWLVAREARRQVGPPVPGPLPAVVSDLATILRGYPAIRTGLRRLLGVHTAEIVINAAGILGLTLAGGKLGLLLHGAEAARALTELMPRRTAWQRYESLIERDELARPGQTVQLDDGDKLPLPARVVHGAGPAVGEDGLPMPIGPGAVLSAGATLLGGPFIVEFDIGPPLAPEQRPLAPPGAAFDRYVRVVGPVSLLCAGLAGLRHRSWSAVLDALVVAGPRVAGVGQEAADLSASARVLRAGVTVVGSRRNRPVRRPDYLLIESPRILCRGFELDGVLALADGMDTDEVRAYAASVAALAGSPWGGALAGGQILRGEEPSFDGESAAATIKGVRYILGPLGAPSDSESLPAARAARARGGHVLVLREEPGRRPVGLLNLRPRLVTDAGRLIASCQAHRVRPLLLSRDDSPASRELARRTGIPLRAGATPVEAIRELQRAGAVVAYLSDSVEGAAGFEAADLAIGLSDGRSPLLARADLISPDISGVAAIIEAGALRDRVARDAVAISTLSNLVGLGLSLWQVNWRRLARTFAYAAAFSAFGNACVRLRGGMRRAIDATQVRDPSPERWGRRRVEDALAAFNSSPDGLTSEEALRRRVVARRAPSSHPLLSSVLVQVSSPLVGIMAAGAVFSLLIGATLDAAIIGGTILANVAIGAWQEHRTVRSVRSLEELTAPTARVVRDGAVVTVPAAEVVPGDILVLGFGDRVAADARLISATNLEVDESALTGESLPVSKMVEGGAPENRIVLRGTTVIMGTGSAVAVAVGADTRLGATMAAVSAEETQESPLADNLSRKLRLALPVAASAGAIVTISGLLRHQSPATQIATGASVAIAAVPEGLPLLVRLGEAAVARRLSARGTVVRRLAAVEALGRVDVACVDKTGTLTAGRLVLEVVADLDQQVSLPSELPGDLHEVLVVGALASPHPGTIDASAHRTDVAILDGAAAAGLGAQILVPREAEFPFGAERAFHANVLDDRLFVKGAPEDLIPRCGHLRRGGEIVPLDAPGRERLVRRVEELAGQGLRVLMVAQGTPDGSPDDPRDLVAYGFLGIKDPLRPTVPAAIRRCRESGIRVIMLTGDHPATAAAIARDAGLEWTDDRIITGPELELAEADELAERLEQVTVVARAKPLDKLRIVESLQRRGHIVAMTGDGVNDAPALQLADVGVAMRHGTEAARQAADMIMAEDDFSNLVEALVEGRSFWRNIRRAVALLLGGNLGELGLMTLPAALGRDSPLTTRQILMVNMITDVLPSLAVALQPPEHRDLASLAREGTVALEGLLRRDILRRGLSTSLPSVGAHLLASRSGQRGDPRTVAFASIVVTQLAQTLSMGRLNGRPNPPVLAAVVGSAALLVGAIYLAPLQALLNLGAVTGSGWLLVGLAGVAAVLLNYLAASLPASPLAPSFGSA